MLKFLPKVRNNSEIDSSCQSNPLGKLNDSLTSFICFISDSTRDDSENIDCYVPIESATTVLKGKISN